MQSAKRDDLKEMIFSPPPVQGMFFELHNVSDTLVNYAVYPVVREYDRMVYLALSEYFFDSGMYAYFKAGVFKMVIANEKVGIYQPAWFLCARLHLPEFTFVA